MITLSLRQWRTRVKPLVFIAAITPALWWAVQWLAALKGIPSGLGFNPNEFSNRFTGDWAIRFLLLSLSMTPMMRLIGSSKPIMFRRMFGLFAAFYAILHLASYLWLDLSLDFGALWQDVLKRNYITIGMTAFVLLIPLAATSNAKAIRWVGAKRWQRLHKSVYLIGLLAIIHFIMMRKGFQLEPLIYAVIYAVLMVARVRR